MAYEYRKIPGHFPHVFYRHDEASFLEVHRWCLAQFGPDWRYYDESPLGRWVFREGDVAFRDDQDAFAFKMRWC